MRAPSREHGVPGLRRCASVKGRRPPGRSVPRGADPVMLDVTDSGQIDAAVRQVEGSLDGERLAGVVNNAGIAVAGPLEFVPIPDLRRQFEVNAVAPVAVTQAFLPMLRRRMGRVVLVG